MKKFKLNLQMFAEGGDSGSSASSDSSLGSNLGVSEETTNGRGDSLDEIVYGKQDEALTTGAESDSNGEDRVSFDELIKGEYKEEFQKKTQSIIDKRFKETKGLQEKLAKQESIMSMLAEKYGADATDIESLQKAIESDDSFYEEEALRKGLTVEQFKEVKRLERENEAFRRAEEEQAKRQNSERIYAEWMAQAEELQAKYGLEGFSMEEETQNPDFVRLLQNGISVESAYKAIHMDQMLTGAMAATASEVRNKISNNIASRQARPKENGLSSSTSQIFKSDPSQFTTADMEEIRKRVMKGERIRL